MVTFDELVTVQHVNHCPRPFVIIFAVMSHVRILGRIVRSMTCVQDHNVLQYELFMHQRGFELSSKMFAGTSFRCGDL